MNRKLYNILKFVPIVGAIVSVKYDYFALNPVIFGGESLLDSDNYKTLNAWCKAHPDQVLSPKKAKELLDAVGK